MKSVSRNTLLARNNISPANMARAMERAGETFRTANTKKHRSVFVLALHDGEPGCDVPMYLEEDGSWTGREPEDVLRESQMFASEQDARAAFLAEQPWYPADRVWVGEYDGRTHRLLRSADLRLPRCKETR